MLAAFDFDTGTLTLTEAGTQAARVAVRVRATRRASRSTIRGGLEVLDAPFEAFRARLHRGESHAEARAHRSARSSAASATRIQTRFCIARGCRPSMLTQKLDDAAVRKLYDAIRIVLPEWTQRLREEANGEFPEKVTAFRKEMAVHGRFGKPCPVCGTSVQRIRYAENETNYCPRCQTGGKLLADRALSRLLKNDWPRTVEELEKL